MGKYYTLFLLFFLPLIQSSMADNKAEQQRAEELLNYYNERVVLTDTQKDSLLPILVEQVSALIKLKAYSPSDAEWLECNDKIATCQDKIEAIFTTAQKELLEAYLKKKRNED